MVLAEGHEFMPALLKAWNTASGSKNFSHPHFTMLKGITIRRLHHDLRVDSTDVERSIFPSVSFVSLFNRSKGRRWRLTRVVCMVKCSSRVSALTRSLLVSKKEKRKKIEGNAKARDASLLTKGSSRGGEV